MRSRSQAAASTAITRIERKPSWEFAMKLGAVALEYEGTIAVDDVMNAQGCDAIAHLPIDGVAVVLETDAQVQETLRLLNISQAAQARYEMEPLSV